MVLHQHEPVCLSCLLSVHCVLHEVSFITKRRHLSCPPSLTMLQHQKRPMHCGTVHHGMLFTGSHRACDQDIQKPALTAMPSIASSSASVIELQCHWQPNNAPANKLLGLSPSVPDTRQHALHVHAQIVSGGSVHGGLACVVWNAEHRDCAMQDSCQGDSRPVGPHRDPCWGSPDCSGWGHQ